MDTAERHCEFARRSPLASWDGLVMAELPLARGSFFHWTVGYFASVSSASSAQLKRLFQPGPRMVWTRAISIVADAADGADDVMESVFSRGRDPDRPHSQSALAAEHNFNPECAEEALRPAQPASECAWTLWPARPVGADLQKIGCASPPLRFVDHDLAYERRHRIGVDDVLNRGAPVVRISGFECARGSKCALAGCGPKREVSHARQPPEADMRQHV